jgi:tetratricopeptide (TPR) repeat protein
MKDFNETVTQFLGEYNISTIKADDIASINQVLTDFAQCKQDMLMRSPEEWIDSIVLLSDCVRSVTGDNWEKKAFRCIAACLLSRLLPSESAVTVLETCPPPVAESEEQYHYNGITREYYFIITETYLDVNRDEKAFRSFEDLEKVGWEFFEFLILKGRVEMRKCEFQKALKTFEKAEKKAEKREKIAALFYRGLAHCKRGNFKEAETAWVQCLDMGCTTDQRIMVSHNLAAVYRLTGALEKAQTLYQDLAAAARLSGIKEFEVKSLLGLANVFIDQCSWGKAEHLLKEIISVCPERMAVVAGLAETNLGVVMDRKGDLDKAFLHHNHALTMVKKEVHPVAYGIICCNMGDVYRKLGKMDKAAAVLTAAVDVVPDEATTVLQALLISLAEVCTDNGELTKGWELTHTILQERWLDNSRSEAEALKVRGKIFLCKHEYAKAKESLQKSENMFRVLNLDYELISVFELLEECCNRLYDEKQVNLYREKREALAEKIGSG